MKKSGFFWVGFSDLMTTLFFLMLVLYVITFVILSEKDPKINKLKRDIDALKRDSIAQKREKDALKDKEIVLVNSIKELEKKLNVFTMVEENLKPLKNNSTLFKYEEEYKRFVLAFDVNFEVKRSEIEPGKLKYFKRTERKIRQVGNELKKLVDELALQKKQNSDMQNVSYILIIAGYASKLGTASIYVDYDISYKRAFNLWKYWYDRGINFEDPKYEGLIDLQISGNGWGGVGRFERDPKDKYKQEKKNQRFIIQIVPKITNNQ